MDAAVRRAGGHRVAGAALAALLAMAGGTVHAQVGGDPTQPPALLAPKAADSEAPREQRLQAVIRGSHGSRSAVISGQLVAVGDTIGTEAGPARVAAIHDDRVVLVRGSARETLALHPSITSPVRAGATSNPPPSRRP
jgi:hypothetical protein